MVFKIIRCLFESVHGCIVKNSQIFELKFGYLRIFVYICIMKKQISDDWKNITKEQLEQEFANGLWHKDIAEKYNVSSRIIYDKVKKLEINIDRKNKKEDKIYVCSVCGKQFNSLKNDTICGHCKSQQMVSEKQEFSNTDSDLGQKIIDLRQQGLSYTKIAEKLNCSKSTVSYHCKEQSRNKTKDRSEKMKQNCLWKYKFQKCISNFRSRVYNTTPVDKCNDWNKKFRTAVSTFKHRGIYMEEYTYQEVIKHLGGTQLKCYLTGTSINILEDDYQLDHILPISKGGTNELSNMGITCPEVNQMKRGLTNEELFSWCKKILEYNGYNVTKIE